MDGSRDRNSSEEVNEVWLIALVACGSKSGKPKVSFHIPSPKSFQTKHKSTKNVQEKEEFVGLRRSVERTQKQRVSSLANESVIVTLFQEELQKIGTFITSTWENKVQEA